MKKLLTLLIGLSEEKVNRLEFAGDQLLRAADGCIPYQASGRNYPEQLFGKDGSVSALLLSGLHIESNRTWSFKASFSCKEFILQAS